MGIRIFKGINDFKVYHFGSIITRRYKITQLLKQSQEAKEENFFIKMGFFTNFFKKYYLKSDTKYNGKLKDPNKTLCLHLSLMINRINYYYVKYVSILEIKNLINK